MSIQDIHLIDMSAKAMVEPFRAGRISVAAALHPYTSLLKEDMGDRVVAWPIQGGRNYYSVITAKDEYLKRNPMIAERFVAALVEAERFVQTHKEEAQILLGERLGLTRGQVLEVWERNLYRVRLDQDLLLLLEDEVKWLMQKQGISERRMPNFLDYLYLDALEKVKPEGVRIVR
jgi:ABC-type nitrate/sulfonate/bicarbonate transport system substrate-binding protein